MPISSDAHTEYMEAFARVFARQILRKYQWLLELAKRHRIQVTLLQSIVDFLDEIVHLRKEGSRLDVGLVLENKQLKLERSPIEVKSFHIHDKSKFSNLRNIVSGSFLCYVVDDKGIVTIRKVPLTDVRETATLTLQNISRKYETITFCIRMSNIEIYDSGELVRIYKRGIWTRPNFVRERIRDLDSKGFPFDLLESVMKLCIKLSEKGNGGVFAIVKNNRLSYCSSMIRGSTFRKCKSYQIPESQIMEFASLDGAVVMNIQSEILGIGQKLEPPPSTNYRREAGRGTRHNSAAMYSGAVDSVVFVVSEDGPISLYFGGDLFARCFEELFGSR